MLNYCTPELALNAARTAAADLDPSLDRVLIVDNQSPDDSAAKIRADLERQPLSHVSLVVSSQNGGFAAGNNVAIRTLNARAYVLLNSDTMVRPGALNQLYSTLMSDESIGIVSPRLEFEDGEPQVSCFRQHSIVSELIHGACTGLLTKALHRFDVPLGVLTEQTDVEWTSFACVMIRREVVERLGPLDEGFFMYYEDADYCRMTRRAGFRIVHEPAGRVVHLRGKSSPVKEATRLKKARPGYYYASRARYFRRAYGPLGALAANGSWTVGRALAFSRELVGQKERHTVERELLDNWRYTFERKIRTR